MQHQSELIAQATANAVIRKRLFRSEAAVKLEKKTADDATIKSLNLRLRSVSYELERMKEENDKLRIAMSDKDARLLAQAKRICEFDLGFDEMDGEVKKRTVREIIAEVLQDYPGVTIDMITSVRRTRDLIEPRHKCYYEVYKQRPDLSYPSIARVFKRDHTSILHAVQKLKGLEDGY